MLLAYVLDAASELQSSSTTPGGEAGPQAAHEAAWAAASSACEAQTMESTPPGALDVQLPCNYIGLCHGSHSSAADRGLLHALGMHERQRTACNLGNKAFLM